MQFYKSLSYWSRIIILTMYPDNSTHDQRFRGNKARGNNDICLLNLAQPFILPGSNLSWEENGICIAYSHGTTGNRNYQWMNMFHPCYCRALLYIWALISLLYRDLDVLLLLRSDVVAGRLANCSADFIWKLRRHWLRSFRRRQIAVVIQAVVSFKFDSRMLSESILRFVPWTYVYYCTRTHEIAMLTTHNR